MTIMGKQVKYLQKGVKQGSLFCAHRFLWDEDNHSLECSNSKWHHAGLYLSCLFTCSYWIFMLWRCASTQMDPLAGITVKMFIGSMTVVDALSVIIQLEFAKHAHRIP